MTRSALWDNAVAAYTSSVKSNALSKIILFLLAFVERGDILCASQMWLHGRATLVVTTTIFCLDSRENLNQGVKGG